MKIVTDPPRHAGTVEVPEEHWRWISRLARIYGVEPEKMVALLIEDAAMETIAFCTSPNTRPAEAAIAPRA